MLVCEQGNCERNGIDDICCKCCDIRYECDFTCYHVFVEDDECLYEIEIEDDEESEKDDFFQSLPAFKEFMQLFEPPPVDFFSNRNRFPLFAQACDTALK